jgi:hypothetical protein
MQRTSYFMSQETMRRSHKLIAILIAAVGLIAALACVGSKLYQTHLLRQRAYAFLSAVQTGEMARLADYFSSEGWAELQPLLEQHLPRGFVERINKAGVDFCWIRRSSGTAMGSTGMWIRVEGLDRDEYYLASTKWYQWQGRWILNLASATCYGPMSSRDWKSDRLEWGRIKAEALGSMPGAGASSR